MTDRFPWLRPGRVAPALLGGVLLTACKDAPPPTRPSPVVAVETVQRGDLPYLVLANGEVEPNRFVAVQAQVTGLLTRVAFAEGDDVREGQVLFEIDPRPFRAELERVEGVLARDEAQLARARTDSTRYATLARDGYVTREQFDQILAELRALTATVAADRASADRARFELSNATVRAPISGRTGRLTFREGNLVRALGEQPLVTINEVRPVLVRFAVPEADFAELRARGGVDRPLPVRIRPAVGDTARRIEGVLAFVDNAVDRSTGAVTLKARVANSDGALWPGQFVQVALELDIDRDVVSVPSQAVVQVAATTFVFTVGQDGTARRVPVTLGRQAGQRVVIASGLQGGEQLVVGGQERVADGMKVQVRDLAGAAAPGAATSGPTAGSPAAPDSTGSRP